jgi:hypothetical protein
MVAAPMKERGSVKRFIFGVLSVLLLSFCFPVSHAEARDFDLAFASGKSYAVVSNAVIRGDRDYYSFGARAGQTITIAVTSSEDNAVVALWFKIDGDWVLADTPPDSRVLYGELPTSDSGQYRIEVGGTRGNATYDLFVGIAAAG